MNIKQIRELVELMNDNNLGEVEVEQEGMKIRLLREGVGAVGHVVAPVMPAAMPASAASAAQAATAEAPAAQSNLKEVKSPMVGTFYKSPAPDAAPYAQVGDVIKQGDVLCIVEAMKLMNEVKAEFGGKVVEVCLENADPVEFGQVLYKIEPM